MVAAGLALSLRKPLLVAAWLVALVVVLTESGGQASFFGWRVPKPGVELVGYGLENLHLLDLGLFVSLTVIVAPLVLPPKPVARVQGLVFIGFAIYAVLLGLVVLIETLAKLVLMVALLLAIPFGTLIYLAKYGDFPVQEAGVVVSSVMLLKVVCAVLVILAHPLFLMNLGLVLQIATTLVAMVVISFLHGFVPGILVSITDAIAGLVNVVLGIVWALVIGLGAIPNVLGALVALGKDARQLLRGRRLRALLALSPSSSDPS